MLVLQIQIKNVESQGYAFKIKKGKESIENNT